MEPWQKLPLREMREAMEVEQMAAHHHRPPYTWFRTFARRSGSLMRFLLLTTLSDPETTTDEILEYRDDHGWKGDYVEPTPLENRDALIVDPMMGSGPTILEGARLGLDVIGLDYNPVLWWVLRQTVAGPTDFDEEFAAFLADANDEIEQYFECPEEETVLAYLMALTIDCPECGASIELHQRFELSRGRGEQSVYLCPNTECDERVLRSEADRSERLTCEHCQTSFTPDDGNYKRGEFQCECGHRERLSDYFERQDRTPSFRRYAVYYEDADNGRGYRHMGDIDRRAISRSQREYRETIDDLSIPTSKIQEGETTNQLLHYNYEQYQQLFTERQRLVLGQLFELADRGSSNTISEALVTIVASTLHFNNIHVAWDPHRDDVRSIFQLSNHTIPVETVEANPLADPWRGSLTTAHSRFSAAKSYLESPHEALRTPSGDLDRISMPEESLNTERIKRLSVSSADRLDIETESIDCVVIDPPYYDNVQYGELLDFYYVWLREVLSDDYPEFSSTHIPKLREVSVNRQRGKDTTYYHRALRNSFEEIHRMLSSDGELVCLFHIGQEAAWRDLVKILIRTGFQIRGAIPLQELNHEPERSRDVHDAVVFARKTSGSKSISFETIRQNLLYEIQDMAKEERDYHPEISEHELRIILRARGLSEFSEHYPNVYNEHGDADVDTAIDMVEEVLQKSL